MLLLLGQTSCPPQQQEEQGLPAAVSGLGTTESDAKLRTLLLLLVLQSGAAVAVVWAHARILTKPSRAVFAVIRLELIEPGAAKCVYNEARPRERSDRGRFLPSGKKASS